MIRILMAFTLCGMVAGTMAGQTKVAKNCQGDGSELCPRECVACLIVPKQLPQFVDAVKKPVKSRLMYTSQCNDDTGICFGEVEECSNNGHLAQADSKTATASPTLSFGLCEGGYVWSCADPKRVLLSSEDGAIHRCMKLGD